MATFISLRKVTSFYTQNTIREKFGLFQIVLNIASSLSNPVAGLSEKYFGIINSFLFCALGFFLVAPINYIPTSKTYKN